MSRSLLSTLVGVSGKEGMCYGNSMCRSMEVPLHRKLVRPPGFYIYW